MLITVAPIQISTHEFNIKLSPDEIAALQKRLADPCEQLSVGDEANLCILKNAVEAAIASITLPQVD